MKNGDISNDVPPRFIVSLDVVSTFEEVTTKKSWLSASKTTNVIKWDMMTLAFLWNYSSRVGVSFELAGFEFDQDELDTYYDNLSNRGTNPFTYVVAYTDVQELVHELPFRRDVRGVIALPSQVARFGSWGIELEYLNG
jgi:hypothetical protein